MLEIPSAGMVGDRLPDLARIATPERRRDDVYIGPDSLMPLASAFAAVAGFVLMFWRKIVGAFRAVISRFSGRN